MQLQALDYLAVEDALRGAGLHGKHRLETFVTLDAPTAARLGTRRRIARRRSWNSVRESASTAVGAVTSRRGDPGRRKAKREPYKRRPCPRC